MFKKENPRRAREVVREGSGRPSSYCEIFKKQQIFYCKNFKVKNFMVFLCVVVGVFQNG